MLIRPYPVGPCVDQQPLAQGGLLRFITCGSVDDGKSTLIGRLLFESKQVYADQLEALKADSRKDGTQGEELDFALLVDGLAAEREQGITIDVAYRYFSTGKRKFIVADTPGHEQYTRNMVTGASTADLAIILVDARKGVLTQTKRHSYLVSLLGIRRIVLAVNKLDLLDYSKEAFERIEREYRAFAAQIGLLSITAIPLSALRGDNLVGPSANTTWYRGPSLIEHLESVQVEDKLQDEPFRMPVQWVNRPTLDFRGFSGRIVGGSVRPGDRLQVLPSGKECGVLRIVTFDGDLQFASSGRSVTLTLDREVDISRGDILSAIESPAGVADKFDMDLIWMADERLVPEKSYLLKIGAKTVAAKVDPPKCRIDINTLEVLPADSLSLNEIGVCTVTLDQRIAFDPYSENRDTGSVILIDRISNNTVGAGMLRAAVRRAQNIYLQDFTIDKKAHAALKLQKPVVVWFTGLSGAGKSTIANLVQRKLHDLGRHTCLLDGDNLRHGLCRDLGFTEADRTENVRRIAEVAKLMVDSGLIVLVACISPIREERRMARATVAADEFCEVFVDTPLAIAEHRDSKGLYKRARRGEIKNFTGVDSPYEPPRHPEIRINTTTQSAEEAAERILSHLCSRPA